MEILFDNRSPELKFATEIAQLIYEVRIESDTPYCDSNFGDEIPEKFANSVLDNKLYCDLMKHNMTNQILQDIVSNPDDFKDKDGNYSYSNEMYFDYYPLVDGFVADRWEESEEKRNLPKETSIPEHYWGVHVNHCCKKCGCKYGDKDCPVVLGITGQRNRCNNDC